MSHTVVLALEGVLTSAQDDVELAQEQLTPAGSILYTGLRFTSRIFLATNLERRLVDHWCRINGLVYHSGVERLDDRTVRRLRAAGETIDLYIDASQERCALALRAGVPTLFFTKPLFARESHRPDVVAQLRPWREIVAESAAQRAARAVPLPEDD